MSDMAPGLLGASASDHVGRRLAKPSLLSPTQGALPGDWTGARSCGSRIHHVKIGDGWLRYRDGVDRPAAGQLLYCPRAAPSAI
jgi:hypothetical protein